MCKTWTEEIRSTTERSTRIYLLEEKKVAHLYEMSSVRLNDVWEKWKSSAFMCFDLRQTEAKASTGINKHFYDALKIHKIIFKKQFFYFLLLGTAHGHQKGLALTLLQKKRTIEFKLELQSRFVVRT